MPWLDGVVSFRIIRCKEMVDVTVVGLICDEGIRRKKETRGRERERERETCTDDFEEIQHGGGWGKVPVLNCDWGRACLLPLWVPALLQVADEFAVCGHRLLLQIPHHLVAKRGREQVRHKVEVPEHPLCEEHTRSKGEGRLLELQKCHQMHSLILRLFQQRVDLKKEKEIFAVSGI
jgi:hypothetical protein